MSPTDREPARIGPNAIIQLLEAGRALSLERELASVFASAGEPDWIARPPAAMVEEQRVTRVHMAARRLLAPHDSAALLTEAGTRTADYLLAHRIPAPVRAFFHVTPRRLGARLLSGAIGRHAWTFAGSGRFRVTSLAPVIFEISENPFCRGLTIGGAGCLWHQAVFQRLFQVLVAGDSRTEETACAALGDYCCLFETTWIANGVLKGAPAHDFRYPAE